MRRQQNEDRNKRWCSNRRFYKWLRCATVVYNHHRTLCTYGCSFDIRPTKEFCCRRSLVARLRDVWPSAVIFCLCTVVISYCTFHGFHSYWEVLHPDGSKHHLSKHEQTTGNAQQRQVVDPIQSNQRTKKQHEVATQNYPWNDYTPATMRWEKSLKVLLQTAMGQQHKVQGKEGCELADCINECNPLVQIVSWGVAHFYRLLLPFHLEIASFCMNSPPK